MIQNHEMCIIYKKMSTFFNFEFTFCFKFKILVYYLTKNQLMGPGEIDRLRGNDLIINSILKRKLKQ